MTASRSVLCLNVGSTSVKAAVLDGAPGGAIGAATRRATVHLAGIGTGSTTLATDAAAPGAVRAPDHAAAMAVVLDHLEASGLGRPDVVGHRLVHGGPDLWAPTVLTPAVRRQLREVVDFAPLHLPAELAAVDVVAERHPQLVQVGCFDTAFHAELPEVARRLPLPRELHEAGIRRYGFHGLSYEWLVATVPEARQGRAVLAHLGGGASLAAVSEGRPVDTTMGLTPTGGLVMTTRTGDLDPGVLLHLARQGRGPDELADLVDRRGGLAGISGRPGDVPGLLAATATGDDDAELALAVYCRRAAQHLAAMAVSLGGLDSVVLTAGVGEHSAAVRARILAQLAHLGVAVDAPANEAGARRISPDGAAVTVLVVPTDEESVVAHHSLAALARR